MRSWGEDNPLSDADEYEKQLKALKADKETKDKIHREIERFKAMPGGSQEANVLRMYLETVLDLPWKKVSKDNNNISHAEEILNSDHYGLEKVKERILEYLAVRVLTKKGTSPIICLVGPPGTGKTSIARSVARALNKQYVRISLGGIHDEAEVRGHRKTYVGAMPGRIVEAMRQAGVSNPLMLLDEIDKVSSDYKGDTSSALLEVLDSEQNVKFRDHYVELPIDLSNVLFIATANTTQTIPGPLLDRMEVIEVNSYTENEKFHIAKNYLVRKQLERNGLTEEQVSITDKALEKIIHNYTREAGVRNLERRIGDICRKAAREFLEDKKKAIRITENGLEKYLGKEKITFEDVNEEDQVGIVRGLAWTSVGGDTLQIEVNVMPGKGTMQMTGQMGDVMKESAQTALSYIRSICPEYGVADDYFEKHDIHLHIPEGAVPKDGPSAGITMATAMLSAVTGRKVDAKLAMTGEITLRGRALPIGGLKEKILAARMAHMKRVLVPDKKAIRITENGLEKYLGKEKITFEDVNEEDQVGIVRGLAWTSVGGDTLQIEVNVMPGKGTMQMTGQMGDVMKESAQTALSYIRSICPEYGVADDYFEKHDIHLHIPEGAVPKDGPSAGITMATAMLSAVTGRKVDAKLAMTGEITLRGRALPIGGLKEKILAARMAHMKRVLVPDKNRPDIAELSKEITKGLTIIFVKDMADVLKEALVSE